MQDSNPNLYVDCGVIINNANIEDQVTKVEGGITMTTINARGANISIGTLNYFLIKNINGIGIEFNSPIVESLTVSWSDPVQFKIFDLTGFKAVITPNGDDEGGVLSIIDITTSVLQEIAGHVAQYAIPYGGSILITIRPTGASASYAILIKIT